jgi:hypothetical protein
LKSASNSAFWIIPILKFFKKKFKIPWHFLALFETLKENPTERAQKNGKLNFECVSEFNLASNPRSA